MLVRGLFFCLALEAIKIVPPYIIKLIVDGLIQPAPDLNHIYFLTFLILVSSLVNTLVENTYITYYIRDLRNAETHLLKTSQQKLLDLDLAFHETHPSGELVHLLNSGASKLVELIWFVHDQFLGASVQIVLTSLVIMHENFEVGLIFIALMPVVLWMLHRFGKKIQPYRKEYHQAFREATWKMNQSLLNVRTVKDFSEEKTEQALYQKDLARYMKLSEVRNRLELSNARNRDIFLSVGRVAILFYVVYLVSAKQVSPGSLFLIATLSEKVIASLFRLGRLYNFLGDAVEAIDQLVDLLTHKTQVVDSKAANTPTISTGKLAFRKVGFSYPNGADALREVSFEIPAKTQVAVVGRSGSGKTSLVKLLFRHYDVSSGLVEIDGINIKDYRLHDLRKGLAIVSQDIEVFDLDVAANIAYGTRANEDEIVQAAKMANAHQFIIELPEGYKTRIGERGIRLSGGQRQRLGIARALLMRPKILVFDEATSSLDTESERLIQQALKDIAGQQTMLVIAHRLSTIQNADQVLVLDSGKVVESGSYAELVRNKGWFAKMLELQRVGELRS